MKTFKEFVNWKEKPSGKYTVPTTIMVGTETKKVYVLPRRSGSSAGGDEE